MTPIRKHLQVWNGCTKCDLHKTRHRMVFTRGTIPCDVVLIGEAPGEGENLIGQPFVGEAGSRELDPILEKSFAGFSFTYALTNLICCIPLDETGSKVTDGPPDYAVKACAPRLQEFIEICNPKLIVCLGRHPQRWLMNAVKPLHHISKSVTKIHVTHPAAIIRANVVQQELMRQRCIIAIRNALEDLLNPPPPPEDNGEETIDPSIPLDDEIPF